MFKMNPWIKIVPAVLLLVASVTAGCIAGPGVEKSITVAGDADGSLAGPAIPPAVAPVVALAASVDGQVVAPTGGILGVAPGTEVVFDASGSSHPDAPLTYAWKVMGQAAPETGATLTRTFEALGDHAVIVTVHAGQQSASKQVTVRVASPPPPPAPAVAAIPYAFAGAFEDLEEDPQEVTFDVPAGAQQIEAWLTWDDGLLGVPLLVAFDVHLLDPEGDEVVAIDTRDFAYVLVTDSEDVVEGTWTITIAPSLAPLAATWDLDVFVWMVEPTVETITDEVVPGINVLYGLEDEPGTGVIEHALDLPAGTMAVTARLTWATPPALSACSLPSRVVNDFDLVALHDGNVMFSSGNWGACEFGGLVAEDLPTGDWTFRVVPWLVPGAEYTLTVRYA